MRVLVVEDDVFERMGASDMFLDAGFRVLEAGNAEEAEALAAAFVLPIHLVIADVIMPGLGGRKLAEQVLRFHSETKVLYLSGYTDDAVVRHGILHDDVPFLQKPFSLLGLARKVREVLDR